VIALEQQSNLFEQPYLSSEHDLKNLLDSLYAQTKAALNQGVKPRFRGLLEYMKSEMTILTAIHNIKSNKGSETPGSDGETMREHILEQDYPEIIARVQQCLTWHQPKSIRRKLILKPGKAEKRKLGIPAIIDRITQECVKMILEPIMEAQFFKHSYGFRPMRDAHMALERTMRIVHDTGYHWMIEGDISKFFDTVNHAKLCKQLYSMGIRDQRVLMIIKAMLKAGIMDEIRINPLGTQQGGIISPLLGNVYLHSFDQWVTREWENKQTKHSYATQSKQRDALKKRSNLKPTFLVRYADDWILATDTKQHAEKWKQRISKHLKSKLKLSLSEEKTFITNLRETPIHFLGCEGKVVKGKSRTGYITRTRPDRTRLKSKIKELHQKMNALKHCRNKETLIHEMNIVNATIRGIIQYYQCTTWVNIILSKYAHNLKWKAKMILKKYGGIWLPANEVNNLLSVHADYTLGIPAVTYKHAKIGITSLAFCKWKKTQLKNPEETPFTKEGRNLYRQRTGKKPLIARADELLSLHFSLMISKGITEKKYNFEYFLNRAYALNRDKGKCRVCGEEVENFNLNIHHINPKLPLETVNRVNNLAAVHEYCHQKIHSQQDDSSLGKKIWSKILKFREKLN
jgi:group II intron reverse transcriptase/maturase